MPCALWRVEGDRAAPHTDRLAAEAPLEIRLNHRRAGLRVTQTLSITMRTPGHDGPLAVGYLVTEGVITSPAQVEAIEPADDAVTVRLRDDVAVDLGPLQRRGTTTSACGVCGKTSLASLRPPAPHVPAPDEPVLELAALHRLPAALRAAQAVFAATGGLHAAALFAANGDLLAVYEDVGRHNAVDKLIGAHFLAGHVPAPSRLLLVSGRASFELVQKAIMAGLPVLAAVGAPSSLAVRLARESGLTLVGFLRDRRFNVYSGVARLPELLEPATATAPAERRDEGVASPVAEA